MRVLLIAALSAAALGAAPRTVTRLDSGWSFQRGDSPTASGWQSVTVPHTWNTEGDPPQSGYYRGPGWYRRTIAAPTAWRGQRVFIRFEAASLAARVSLNGHELGEHLGGFQAFCFELTPYLQFGGNNELSVRVDNSRREDVIPLGGDFTIFGGIYRPVSLIVTGPIDITPLDAGSPGVFLRPSAGSVEATVEVSNSAAGAGAVDVSVTVLDAQNQKVAAVRKALALAAGETKSLSQTLSIPQPHMWNGVADPYLYTVRVELLQNGRVIDSLAQPLGLRSFAIDPTRGAVLNGKPEQIHGVCRHQDWAGLGWAIGEKEQDTDMRLMREMGVNGVRLAHYQHNEYFYSLADRTGLLVWAELPMVNDVRGTPEFLANARRQLTELIRQNMNHPSIVMWSLYNEISPGNQDNPVPIVENLNALARQEDPGRITTGAFSIDGIEKLPAVGRIAELVALNVYPGWYIGTAADMGSIIDKWNEFYGSRGLIISEYGGGAEIDQHQQDFSDRPAGRALKDWHPEEWQALVHEATYAAIRARPAVPASFLWSMFDFASAGRKEGHTPGVNDKGLVTRDRKVKKDAYYFYQANWTTEPMVYITSRRDAARTVAATPVKIYSNLPKVALTVNGRSYGELAGSDLHVFQWNNVALAEGENRIGVAAKSLNGTVRDSCVWTYHPKGAIQ